MLDTNLKHLSTREQLGVAVSGKPNVVVCCGRMGPMCVPVYAAMEELESTYSHVAFYDMEFDIPAADAIRSLPECRSFMGLPFTVYYKDGAVAKATSSMQSRAQIEPILKAEFGDNS
jgi:thioredoxin 1